MPLEVRRRPLARSDRLDIWLYIAADNMIAADAVAERLDDAVARLGDYPLSGAERNALANGLRICPVDNYVIYYRVHIDHIDILRILHAARDVSIEMLSP